MATIPPIARAYRSPDPEMMEHIRTVYLLFVEYRADFTAFDHSLDEAYTAAWLAELLAAEGVVRDYAVVGVIRGRTAGVGAAMKAAREAWRDVEFFAKKAFANTSPATLSSFGFRELRAAGSRQDAMVEALRLLYTMATENAATLIARGFSQAGIDAVDAARAGLEAANSAQETAIKERRTATERRIQTLNAPYLRMVEVNAAARRVYKGDVVMRRMFKDRRGG